MSIYIIYKVTYLLYNYYGDNMNEKGFTLIELLAVIALLAIIIVFAVPNVLKVFSEGRNKLSNIQKNQIKSAVEMYINDYCTEPIGYNVCPSSLIKENDSNGIIKVTGGTISLETIASSGYFNESEILHNCTGNISINNGKIDLSNITCNFNN